MSKQLLTCAPLVLLLACGGGGDGVKPVTPTPPSFTVKPQDQTVRIPNRVTFSAKASGTTPMTFAWTKNGTPLPGETQPVLALPLTETASAGIYTVTALNALGSDTAAATLVLKPGQDTAPVLLSQPTDVTVDAGKPFRLEVDATGRGPLAYTWNRNGQPLSGVDGWVLEVPSASASDAGTYRVTVQGALAPAAVSRDILVTVKASVQGVWAAAGTLSVPRAWHTATRLTDGRVMVAGGQTANGPTDRVEIYNPATGIWSDGPSMRVARSSHTATLLSNGAILLAGGMTPNGPTTAAEVWTPNGTTAVPGPLGTPRSEAVAGVLSDGSVLVAGGTNGTGLVGTVERFTWADGTFRVLGALTEARRSSGVATLADGALVVVGGYGVFDATDRVERLSLQGSRELARLLEARGEPLVLALPDGRVLAVGGSRGGAALATTEVFTADAAVGGWRSGPTLLQGRWGAAASVLADGSILVTGGSVQTSCEVLTLPANLAQATRRSVADMAQARRGHSLTLMPDGRVLAVGGFNLSGYVAQVEVFR